MPLKATIGMVNYTGTACTFFFEESVCILPDDMDKKHHKVQRLLALFPGTKIEELNVEAEDQATPEAPAKVEEPVEAVVVEDAEDEEVEEVVEEVVLDDDEEEEEDDNEGENEPVAETEVERLERMVKDHDKDELIEMAEELGIELGSRATKAEIAVAIVAAQDAE